MPPIVFVDAAPVTVVADEFSFVTPAKARLGDALFLLVASGGGLDILDDELVDGRGAKWQLVQTIETGGYSVYLLRRDLRDADPEPAIHAGLFLDGSPAAGAVVVLRNVATSTPATGTAHDETAATVHTLPSQDLAIYSSLYLGLLVCTGTTVGVTPNGTVALLANDATRTTLVIYRLPEAPGTYAIAPTTATARDGVVASFRIDAGPTLGAGLAFTLDPVGAPGLPLEGI